MRVSLKFPPVASQLLRCLVDESESMKRRNLVLLIIACVAVLVGAIVAGMVVTGNNQSHTGTLVQKQIDEALKGSDYLEKATVTTYDSSMSGESLDSGSDAKSAAVTVDVKTINKDVVADLTSKLPDFGDFPVLYKIAYTKDDAVVSILGFSKKDFDDDKIATNLDKVLDVYTQKSSGYLQVTAGAMTDSPDDKAVLSATFTAPSDVHESAKDSTAYALQYASEEVDVSLVSLTVSQDFNQQQSYVSTQAIMGAVDGFETRLQFGLNFASAEFNADNRIVVYSQVSNKVIVTYNQLSGDQTYDGLVKTAQDINTAGDYGLEITVIDPNQAG